MNIAAHIALNIGEYISQYLTKKFVIKSSGKVKIKKAPAGFALMTQRFVENTPSQCATLLGNNTGKEAL